MSLTQSSKLIVAGLVLTGLAAGVFIVMKNRGKKTELPPASLADITACGKPSDDQKISDELLRNLIANAGEHSPEGKLALSRNLTALPDRVIQTLQAKNIKLATESARANLRCIAPGAAPIMGQSLSCITSAPNFGDVLIISTNPGNDAEGKPIRFNEKDIIDSKTLPLVFWRIFENLWNTTEERDLIDEAQASRANNFGRIKRYITEGFKFGPKEQDYYHSEFGGSGTLAPSFNTRTFTLLAANLYCSESSFKRLSGSQPEAVKRFMSTIACSLGKPWHLADNEFKAFCDKKI